MTFSPNQNKIEQFTKSKSKKKKTKHKNEEKMSKVFHSSVMIDKKKNDKKNKEEERINGNFY